MKPYARRVSVGCVLVFASFAHALGGDHPATAVFGTNWPIGIANLVNAPNRVHGYWFNDYDCFFFRGDTSDLNAFLARCATSPATIHLTLHPGKLEVRSPWDKQPRDLRGNWSLALSAGTLSTLGPDISAGLNVVRIDAYLDGNIRLDQLNVPPAVIVRSGGEIEAFVRDHPKR